MKKTTSSRVQYIPPGILPKPNLPDVASVPLCVALLGVLGAIGVGVALFGVSRLIYIYFLYNIVCGALLGLAISHGIGKIRVRGASPLVLLTAVCSLVVYLMFNVALMLDTMSEIPKPSLDLIDFLRFRAENDPIAYGVESGAVGNYLVWTAEFLLTWYAAWSTITEELRLTNVESVPGEVTDFILYLFSSAYQLDDVRRELTVRGWADTTDQDSAFAAVYSLPAVARAAQEGHGPTLPTSSWRAIASNAG